MTPKKRETREARSAKFFAQRAMLALAEGNEAETRRLAKIAEAKYVSSRLPRLGYN